MYYTISLLILLTTPRVVLEELIEKGFEVCWHDSFRGRLIPSKDMMEVIVPETRETKVYPLNKQSRHFDYIHCMYEGEKDPEVDLEKVKGHLLVYNQRVETNEWREGRHED